MKPPPPQALVLDDSATLSLLLQCQLKSAGLDAFGVETEADMLKHLKAAAVAFVELQLWQTNGFQVARRLAHLQACPVVLISGTGRPTDLHWGLRSGAAVVMTRPVLAPQLQRVLQHLQLWGPV